MLQNSGKRDRANQEVFLHENPVALTNLPLEGLNKLWLKKHKSSLKLNSTKNVSVENYIKKDKSKAQFSNVNQITSLSVLNKFLLLSGSVASK